MERRQTHHTIPSIYHLVLHMPRASETPIAPPPPRQASPKTVKKEVATQCMIVGFKVHEAPSKGDSGKNDPEYGGFSAARYARVLSSSFNNGYHYVTRAPPQYAKQSHNTQAQGNSFIRGHIHTLIVSRMTHLQDVAYRSSKSSLDPQEACQSLVHANKNATR